MTYETALLIIPPPPVQAFSYPWREEHDQESFVKVPAHITLFYPFVPPENVDDSVAQLEKLGENSTPFDVLLDKYGQFEGVLFLEPADPDPIKNLYHSVAEAFPEYAHFEINGGTAFHPHLTLARSDSPKGIAQLELPPEPQFSFTVKKIHLYLGSPDDEIPYVPRAVIPLGAA